MWEQRVEGGTDVKLLTPIFGKKKFCLSKRRKLSLSLSLEGKVFG